jgi:hypothetical protein
LNIQFEPAGLQNFTQNAAQRVGVARNKNLGRHPGADADFDQLARIGLIGRGRQHAIDVVEGRVVARRR